MVALSEEGLATELRMASITVTLSKNFLCQYLPDRQAFHTCSLVAVDVQETAKAFGETIVYDRNWTYSNRLAETKNPPCGGLSSGSNDLELCC